MRGRRFERHGGGGSVPLITLVLGGARSGKSEVGEAMAALVARGGHVTYVATAVPAQGDEDFAGRIARHRSRRPADWRTIEVPLGGDLAAALGEDPVVLVDSLGAWVAGCEGFVAEGGTLVEALERRAAAGAATVLVSEEVGLGVHPETRAGRRFRDALGELNSQVAAAATDVILVVAGRSLRLEGRPL